MPQTPTYPTGETIDPTEHHETHEGLATGDLDSPSNKMATFRSEALNDFVASGGLWSADDLTVDLLASMTSVVAYIGGVRVLSNAISARAFTASMLTAVDLGDDGVIDYNEGATIDDLSTLATNHIRLAVIVSDGSSNVRLYDRRNLSPLTIARCKAIAGAVNVLWIDSIPAKNNLFLKCVGLGSGGIASSIRLNDDSGNNYAYRRSVSGAADTTAVNQTNIALRGYTDQVEHIYFHIVNIATAIKILVGYANSGNSSAASAPTKVEYVHKWVNTSDQINRIDYIDDGAGSWSVESEMIVSGHD